MILSSDKIDSTPESNNSSKETLKPVKYLKFKNKTQ